MKRSAAILGVLAACALAPPAGAQETGTSSEGVRFTLDGAVVTIVLGRPLAPGRRLKAECGRATYQRRAIGRGRAKGRGLRTVRVRLHRDVDAPEWCEFSVAYTGRRGAAALSGAPAFEPLVPGPDVREAPAGGRNGGGRFLLRGSMLTVEMNRPFGRSVVAGLGCGGSDEAIGFRRIAVSAGQRVIAVDTEADLGAARWCLLEAPGGADHLDATLP